MRGVVDLDVAAQNRVVLRPVEVDAVAPQLLLGGEQITVARHEVEGVGLAVFAAVGIEVVAPAAPDVGPVEEIGVVGGHVVNHRIARELVLVAAHFDLVDRHQLLGVGIVIAAHRFEDVLAVGQHSAACEKPDIVLGIEPELVGIERGIAVDHLDDGRIDTGLVDLAVVVGPVAVDVGGVLVD